MNKMQRNGRTNIQNNTKFERNLAMVVIYLPVKFDFDQTNGFWVRVRKRTMLTNEQNTKKRTNEQTEYHQIRKQPSYDGDLSPYEVLFWSDTLFSS